MCVDDGVEVEWIPPKLNALGCPVMANMVRVNDGNMWKRIELKQRVFVRSVKLGVKSSRVYASVKWLT
jgi:hypothetical protein